MTPKEKALELLEKMFIGSPFDYPNKTEFKQAKENAKQCALICIDDEIKMLDELGNKLYNKLGTDSYVERCIIYDLETELEEIKNEIEKL